MSLPAVVPWLQHLACLTEQSPNPAPPSWSSGAADPSHLPPHEGTGKGGPAMVGQQEDDA